MSGKRPSLAESMRAVAKAPEPVQRPQPIAVVAEAPPKPYPTAVKPPEQPPAEPKRFYAATRAEKKKATVPLNSEAHRQLKLLAVDHGGVEALLIEAVNDLFRKHGKEPIA